MTVAAHEEASPAPRERLLRRAASNPLVRIVIRWLVVLVVLVFAYWRTFGNLVVEMRSNTVITYVLGSALLALIAAAGVTIRRTPDRPIYDRQTDNIVGGLLLILALCIQALLRPRYGASYLILHLDLVSMLLFLAGGLVLMFGLRPVTRYRWVWFLLAVMVPYPYRVLVIALGGSYSAAGLVMIGYSALAAAVAVGRTRRRALIGAGIAVLVGLVLLVGVATLFPSASIIAYQLVPSVGAAFTVGVVMYVFQRRDQRWWVVRPARPVPLTAPDVAGSAVGLVVVGIIIHFFPSPLVVVDRGAYFAGLDTRPPLAVPAGWVERGNQYFDWASSMYGSDAIAARQQLEQRTGSTQFDKDGRPRVVMVDSIDTGYPITLSVYTATSDYRVNGDRVSAEVPVALPHNITGELQTAVDDRAYLTYNRLTWRWSDGNRTQMVSLLSVDDHEPDVVFPQPQVTTVSNLGILATILLRGNLVVEDLQPSFKDRDLLVGLAGGLIETNLAQAAEAAR